jgi:hypothetical protein
MIDARSADPLILSELQHVMEQLSLEFESLSSSLKRPNILLIGKTGAGMCLPFCAISVQSQVPDISRKIELVKRRVWK